MKKSRLTLTIGVFCIATAAFFLAFAALITIIGLFLHGTLFGVLWTALLKTFTFVPVMGEGTEYVNYIVVGTLGLLVLLTIVFLIVALARKKARALWGVLALFLTTISSLGTFLFYVVGDVFIADNPILGYITLGVGDLTSTLGLISFVLAVIAICKKEKQEIEIIAEEVEQTENKEETIENLPEINNETEETKEPEVAPVVEETKPVEQKPVELQPRVVIVPDASREIVINIVTKVAPVATTKTVTPKPVAPKPVEQKPAEVKVVEPQPTEPKKVIKKVIKKVVVKKEPEVMDNGRPKPIPPQNRSKAPTVKVQRIKQEKVAATTKPVKGDFKERILAQTKEIQSLYNELKSYIFQYAIKARIENENEVIHYGDETYMLIAVLGSKLKVYYALNPQPYLKTTHPPVDASKHQKYALTPTEFSIKDERDLKRAKELVEDLMVNKGRRKGKFTLTNWVKELKEKK